MCSLCVCVAHILLPPPAPIRLQPPPGPTLSPTRCSHTCTCVINAMQKWNADGEMERWRRKWYRIWNRTMVNKCSGGRQGLEVVEAGSQAEPGGMGTKFIHHLQGTLIKQNKKMGLILYVIMKFMSVRRQPRICTHTPCQAMLSHTSQNIWENVYTYCTSIYDRVKCKCIWFSQRQAEKDTGTQREGGGGRKVGKKEEDVSGKPWFCVVFLPFSTLYRQSICNIPCIFISHDKQKAEGERERLWDVRQRENGIGIRTKMKTNIWLNKCLTYQHKTIQSLDNST